MGIAGLPTIAPGSHLFSPQSESCCNSFSHLAHFLCVLSLDFMDPVTQSLKKSETEPGRGNSGPESD